MSDSPQKLLLEFEKDESYINLKVSENFDTENYLFDELAYYLGALEHHHQKDSASIHLTTLEKLEILCNKARLYAEEESEDNHNYTEIKVVRSDEKYTINNPGRPTEICYDDIRLINNDLILVRKDDLYGILDLAGSQVLPAIYNEIQLISKNIVYAGTKDAISLYSENGELLHSDLEDFLENHNPFGNKEPYFWLKKKGKWGLFDCQLKEIIPFRFEYNSCELISDNAENKIYIKVFSDGKCGLIEGLLNVEVLRLNEDIKNIVIPRSKNFLLVKKNNQEISVLEEELHDFESNSQDVPTKRLS